MVRVSMRPRLISQAAAATGVVSQGRAFSAVGTPSALPSHARQSVTQRHTDFDESLYQRRVVANLMCWKHDLLSDLGGGGVSEGIIVTHEAASVCYEASQPATIVMCYDKTSDRIAEDR